MQCAVQITLALTVTVIGPSASDTNELRCTLPPFPKHGSYLLENNGGSPGDKVKSFRLKFNCNAGFKGIGSDTMICFEDGRILHSDFECLPYCERSEDVLTCGAEPRCAMKPEPKTYVVKDRTWDNYEECGVLYPNQRERRQVSLKGAASAGQRRRMPVIAAGRRATSSESHAGVYSKKTRPYMQICGGTLVTSHLIISAAHCFWKEDRQQPAADFAVAVGKIYRPWNEPRDYDAQKSDVSEIRIPPHFRGHATNLQDDIALLIVTSPFSFTTDVRPACLSFDFDLDQWHLRPNNLGLVLGWGLTAQNGSPSQVLQQAHLPVVTLQECFQQTEPQFLAHITSDKFCAGWTNGTAVCKGDSGGGFFIPHKGSVSRSTSYYLRGVVSGAPQSEHLCNIYTWATFTHVLKHERFIKDTLEEIEKITESSSTTEPSNEK